MWNIEPTLTEGAKYCFPREWQREMWQHIYYTSSNIFTTRPFESNIFASPALDVYPFLSLHFPPMSIVSSVVHDLKKGVQVDPHWRPQYLQCPFCSHNFRYCEAYSFFSFFKWLFPVFTPIWKRTKKTHSTSSQKLTFSQDWTWRERRAWGMSTWRSPTILHWSRILLKLFTNKH